MRDRERSPNEPEWPADEAVDRRLREALEPPPGAAGRIVRRVLDGEGSEEPQPRRPLVIRPAAAAAVAGLALAAIALAALLLLPRPWLGERTPGDGGGAAERAAEPPARAARYSITNRGEVIVVQALDGGPSSLLANRATPEWRPTPPGRKLLVHGGTGP